jgi:hypothetical protein
MHETSISPVAPELLLASQVIQRTPEKSQEASGVAVAFSSPTDDEAPATLPSLTSARSKVGASVAARPLVISAMSGLYVPGRRSLSNASIAWSTAASSSGSISWETHRELDVLADTASVHAPSKDIGQLLGLRRDPNSRRKVDLVRVLTARVGPKPCNNEGIEGVLEDGEDRSVRTVASLNGDGPRARDRALGCVGVVKDEKLGIGQWRVAIEDRPIRRDGDGLGARVPRTARVPQMVRTLSSQVALPQPG